MSAPLRKIRLFADGADHASILRHAQNPLIRGFTTNPTLMAKAGVKDYEAFARVVLAAVPDRPVSLEVLADEFREMESQARRIHSWGPNVYVKVPITNTRGECALHVVRTLSQEGVRVNVTAVLTPEQVRAAASALEGGAAAFVSVFAGRIADTGRDPLPAMREALDILRPHPKAELIWASPRELLNIVQAEEIGCPIITVTEDLLSKLDRLGRDLTQCSLETVRMFYEDARKSGFRL